MPSGPHIFLLFPPPRSSPVKSEDGVCLIWKLTPCSLLSFPLRYFRRQKPPLEYAELECVSVGGCWPFRAYENVHGKKRQEKRKIIFSSAVFRSFREREGRIYSFFPLSPSVAFQPHSHSPPLRSCKASAISLSLFSGENGVSAVFFARKKGGEQRDGW